MSCCLCSDPVTDRRSRLTFRLSPSSDSIKSYDAISNMPAWVSITSEDDHRWATISLDGYMSNSTRNWSRTVKNHHRTPVSREVPILPQYRHSWRPNQTAPALLKQEELGRRELVRRFSSDHHRRVRHLLFHTSLERKVGELPDIVSSVAKMKQNTRTRWSIEHVLARTSYLIGLYSFPIRQQPLYRR